VLALLAGLAVASAYASVLAEEPPETEPMLDFRWDAPEGCPDQSEVRTKVDRLLERAPTRSRQGRVTAIARIREVENETWHLRLWVVTATETRERSLEHRGCDALADATALVLAIAIAPELLANLDPESLELLDHAAEPEPAADAAESPREPDDGPQQPEAVRPRPSPAPKRSRSRLRPRGGARLAAGVGAGALPKVGAEISLVPALLWRRARFEVLGRYSPRRSVRFADVPDSGADLSMWTVGARGCPVFTTRVPLEFPLCAGFEIGQIRASDVNLVDGEKANRLWAAFSLAAAVVYVPIRHLAVWALVEGFAPVTRPRFTAEGEREPLHRPWPAGVRALIGPEVRFP
jgi:hypothetical protein